MSNKKEIEEEKKKEALRAEAPTPQGEVTRQGQARRHKVDNGQLTIAFNGAWIGRNGEGSGHEDGLRIQLYWPRVVLKNYKRGKRPWQRAHKELLISAPTRIRLVWEEGYWGVGGEVLGFGGAMDWQKQRSEAI